MNKLTAKKCREQIAEWERMMSVSDIAVMVERHLQAYRIALPILEQQEQGDAPDRKESLKHVGYLFVNSGGGVVYSPSGFGMRGFTCAGKIYGDVSFQPEQPTSQNGEQ